MRVLIIENGVIANAAVLPDGSTIAADGKSATWSDADAEGGSHTWEAPTGATLYASETADIGWSVDKKGQPVPPAPPSMPNTPPASVTSAQAKIQLRRAGLRDKVDAAVQAAGGEVLDWFTDARTWERNNPYVAQIGTSLNLKAADIDALFVAASQIAA